MFTNQRTSEAIKQILTAQWQQQSSTWNPKWRKNNLRVPQKQKGSFRWREFQCLRYSLSDILMWTSYPESTKDSEVVSGSAPSVFLLFCREFEMPGSLRSKDRASNPTPPLQTRVLEDQNRGKEWIKKQHGYREQILNFHRYQHADFLREDNASVIVGLFLQDYWH